MVYTRSQKAKEENDIELLKQQSLAEQSQRVSVLKEPQYVPEAATVPPIYITPADTSLPEVAEQDRTAQDLVVQNIAKHGIIERAVAKHDIVEQTIAEEAIIKLDIVEETIIQHIDIKQDTSAYDDIDDDIDDTVGNVGDKSFKVSGRLDAKMEHGNDYQISPSLSQKKEGKVTFKEAAANKTTPQQKPTGSDVAPQTAGDLTLRQRKIVIDNPSVDVAGSEDTEHAKCYEGSAADEDNDGTAVKKAEMSKNLGIMRAAVDSESSNIPGNPVDGEEDLLSNNSNVVNMQKRYSLRKRIDRSDDGKTPAAALSHPTKSIKSSLSKKTHAGIVVKSRQKNNEKTELIVKLIVNGKLLVKFPAKVKKTKKALLKRIRTPKDFFTNTYRFKLRWTPFEEYPQVNEQTYQDVYDLLVNSLSAYDISLDRTSTDTTATGEPQGPMHASTAVTVDAIVKVIMSQATDNDNALLAQARLIKAFPYTVNGETVLGKTPNYHDVRVADFSKLADALAPAGLHIKRAAIIAECLTAIRQKNIDAHSAGCNNDSNPPDAAQFVPGSLSLDYLSKLTGQEMFDELVDLPGIGVKTACCIMAFNFQLPVFAVDTHVFRIVQWLGWVPEGCNRNDAAAHLDHFIPDELKYGLHQGFWHHGQKCLRCMAKNDPQTKGWEDAVCVIEQFLKRHPKKERKSPSPKRKRDVSDDDKVEGDGSPKPKARKANKILPFSAITAEEASKRGYELVEIPREDNFDTAGANVTGTIKKWVEKTVQQDS